jgi:competence protein ComEC
MWLGALACLAGQFGAHAALPFTGLTAPLLVYLQWLAHVTAATPVSVVKLHLSPPAIVAGWGVLIAGLATVLKRGHRGALAGPRLRARHWLAVPAAAAAGVLVIVHVADGAPRRAPGELVVSFLSIGQGDATLFQLDKAAVLVDTGPPDGPILQRLKEAGVKRLDALMTTHAEADHEGAAPQVVAAYHPRIVIDGGAGWTSRVQRFYARMSVQAPKAGEVIAIGGLRFTVLWPPPRAPGWTPAGNPNDSALVTRLEADGVSVLLTADAESPVLTPLDPAPVDVLKVSHHGSADPGLAPLLQRLRPRVAAIEVGLHNTYGHPVAATLAALKAAVPTVVRTDLDGTVRLHVLNGRVWLERHA